MNKYVFRNYSSKLKKQFVKERSKMLNILPHGIKIEHIGSTAIPGLGGKNIIDVMIASKKKQFQEIKDKLASIGYEFKHTTLRKDRLYFRTRYEEEPVKKFHVHLTNLNSKMWKEAMKIKNYLLTNKQAVHEYAKIKKEAVKKGLRGHDYRQYKKKFIESIIKKKL